MQRGDTRSRTHADLFGHGGHGGAGHGGVGIGAAKGVEMPFRRPDRAEPVLVGKFRAFQQGFIFLRSDAIVIAPVIDREFHPPGGGGQAAVGNLGGGLVARQHQPEAPRQRPEQFQHGNVEAERGYGQPCVARRMGNARIHPGKEIGDVAVFHHHALWGAGRAGRIDQIGQIAARRDRVGGAVSRAVQPRIGIHLQQLRLMRWQIGGKRGLRDDHATARIRDVMRQPVPRIGGIKRYIGAPGLEDRQCADHQIGCAPRIQPHQRSARHTHVAQHMRGAVGARVHLGVAEDFVAEHQRRGVWCPGHLCLELGGQGEIRVEFGIRGIPAFQQLGAFGIGQDRQGADRAVIHHRTGQQFQPCHQPRGMVGGHAGRIVMQGRGALRQHKRQRRAFQRAMAGIKAQGQIGHGGRGEFGIARDQVAGKAAVSVAQRGLSPYCAARRAHRALQQSGVQPQRHPVVQIAGGMGRFGPAIGDVARLGRARAQRPKRQRRQRIRAAQIHRHAAHVGQVAGRAGQRQGCGQKPGQPLAPERFGFRRRAHGCGQRPGRGAIRHRQALSGAQDMADDFAGPVRIA